MNEPEAYPLDLATVAHHEAGHAVAGCVLGRALLRVWVDWTGRAATGGCCDWDPPAVGQEQPAAWWMDEILIGLAGPAAEAMFRRVGQVDGGEDLKGARYLLTRIAVPGTEPQAIEAELVRQASRAARLLRDNQTAVEALAAALEQRHLLDGDEVKAIIGAAAQG